MFWIVTLIVTLIVILLVYYYCSRTYVENHRVICVFYPGHEGSIIPLLERVMAKNEELGLNYPIEVRLLHADVYRDLEGLIKRINQLHPAIKVMTSSGPDLAPSHYHISWNNGQKSVWSNDVDGTL